MRLFSKNRDASGIDVEWTKKKGKTNLPKKRTPNRFLLSKNTSNIFKKFLCDPKMNYKMLSK